MPRGSMPSLVKKVRSSEESSTFTTIGATALSLTGTRFSEVNVAITDPFAARSLEYKGSGGMTSRGSPVANASRFAAPTITVELTAGTKTPNKKSEIVVLARRSNVAPRCGGRSRLRSEGSTQLLRVFGPALERLIEEVTSLSTGGSSTSSRLAENCVLKFGLGPDHREKSALERAGPHQVNDLVLFGGAVDSVHAVASLLKGRGLPWYVKVNDGGAAPAEVESLRPCVGRGHHRRTRVLGDVEHVGNEILAKCSATRSVIARLEQKTMTRSRSAWYSTMRVRR